MTRPPEFRIVSLVPSLTDLCFTLGIGQHVVGRTDYCISPAEHMPSIASVGGPQSVDPKRFRELKPTHVLISPEENKPDILPLIESCGAEVVLVDPHTPEDNAEVFRKFGETFACVDQANALTQDLNHALQDAHTLREATREICVLPLIWKDPWITPAAPTYAAQMLAAVGISVPSFEASGRYPAITDPSALSPQPEVIVLTTEPYTFTETHFQEVSAAFACDHIILLQGETLAWYGSYAIPALKNLILCKQKLLDACRNDT